MQFLFEKACVDKDKSLHLQPLRKRGDVRVIECGGSVGKMILRSVEKVLSS